MSLAKQRKTADGFLWYYTSGATGGRGGQEEQVAQFFVDIRYTPLPRPSQTFVGSLFH